MEPSANLTSHNARIGHIRKFCMVPPARGHTLRLVTLEEPPTILGEWTRAECDSNGSTALDVDARLVEHTQTVQEDTQANLVWCAETGAVVAGKRLKARYVPETTLDDPAMAAQAEALGITGTQQGILVQYQRSHEAHLRMYLSAQQTQVGQLTGLVRDLGGMLRDTIGELHKAHSEIDKRAAQRRDELEEEAEATLREAMQTAPANSNGDPHQDLLRELKPHLEKAVPLVISGLMAMAQAKMLGAGTTPPAQVPARQPPQQRPPAPPGAPRPTAPPPAAAPSPAASEPAAPAYSVGEAG